MQFVYCGKHKVKRGYETVLLGSKKLFHPFIINNCTHPTVYPFFIHTNNCFNVVNSFSIKFSTVMLEAAVICSIHQFYCCWNRYKKCEL